MIESETPNSVKFDIFVVGDSLKRRLYIELFFCNFLLDDDRADGSLRFASSDQICNRWYLKVKIVLAIGNC